HGLTYGCDAASVLEVDDDAFVLNSFSKYFGMTGWRLGWLVAPADAVPELEKLAQNLYISAPSMAQHAALACFEPATLEILEARRAEFARRRDFLLPALRELGFNIAVVPEGAFYLYADISAFGGDAFAFCRHMLETQFVAITPGLDFGRHQAGHHVRFAYTQDLPRLEHAVERIARGLQSWQGSCVCPHRWTRAGWSAATSAFSPLSSATPATHCASTAPIPARCSTAWARARASGFSAATTPGASCRAPGNWWKPLRGAWPACIPRGPIAWRGRRGWMACSKCMTGVWR